MPDRDKLPSGSNARYFSTTVSQRSPSFDERIINFTYTIQKHLLEIVVCPLNMLVDYPQSLTNADIWGQGNLNMVREKSRKCQGISLSIVCGNPTLVNVFRIIPEFRILRLTFYSMESQPQNSEFLDYYCF